MFAVITGKSIVRPIIDIYITTAEMNLLSDDAFMAVLESDSGPDVLQPGRNGN
jgi:hypothetical protein